MLRWFRTTLEGDKNSTDGIETVSEDDEVVVSATSSHLFRGFPVFWSFKHAFILPS
jgi:hypothetical protein